MKKVLLLTLAFVAISTAKAQTDSIQLGKNVLEAIKSGKIENLKKLVAPPSVFREIYAETKELTDEQIIEKTSESDKLKTDFDNLMAEAKTSKVDLNKLEYEKITVENPWGGDESPRAINIFFTYNGKKGDLALSAFRHKDNWYFMKILMSTNVFEGL